MTAGTCSRKAAASKTYCDDVKGTAAKHGITITELSTHLQGQLVAVHPAYQCPPRHLQCRLAYRQLALILRVQE